MKWLLDWRAWLWSLARIAPIVLAWNIGTNYSAFAWQTLLMYTAATISFAIVRSRPDKYA